MQFQEDLAERREIVSGTMLPFTATERTALREAGLTSTGTGGVSDEHRTMEVIQGYLKAHPEKILVEGDSCYPHKEEITKQSVSSGAQVSHGQTGTQPQSGVQHSERHSGTRPQSRGDINDWLKVDLWDRSHWTDPRARKNVVIAIIGENNLPKLLYEYNISGRAWTSDPSSYALRRARIAESAILLGQRVRDPWPEFNPYAPPEEGILGRIKFLEDEGYITPKTLQYTQNLQAVQTLWSILVLVITIWSLLQILKWVWSCCFGDSGDDGEEWGSANREPNLRERRNEQAGLSSNKERRLSAEEESELRVDPVLQNESEIGMQKAAFASSAFGRVNGTVHDSAVGVRQNDYRTYIPVSKGNNGGREYRDKYAYQQHQRSTRRYGTPARTGSVAESGTRSSQNSIYETPHGNLGPTPRQPRSDQHNSRYGVPQQRGTENSNTILDDCFDTTDAEEDFTYEPSDQGYSHDEDYSEKNHHIDPRKETFEVDSNRGPNNNERVVGDPIMQTIQPQAPTPDNDRGQPSTKQRRRDSRRAPLLNGHMGSR